MARSLREETRYFLWKSEEVAKYATESFENRFLPEYPEEELVLIRSFIEAASKDIFLGSVHCVIREF